MGSHVVPTLRWPPPAPTRSASAAFVEDHADHVQYQSDGSDWFLAGRYVGLGNPSASAHVCLYASARGVVVQNEFHDGSRYRRDTGPCHSFAPSKNVFRLNADGTWTWIGPAPVGQS